MKFFHKEFDNTESFRYCLFNETTHQLEGVYIMLSLKNRDHYIKKLMKVFPEIVNTRIVTRAQCQAILPDQANCVPGWMRKNIIGRGVYKLDEVSEKFPAPVEQINENVENNEVSMFSSATPIQDMIPVKDKNFVPFGNFPDLEKIIKSNIFYPAYIVGPTGNGKSTMVEQICARHKKPLIRVNLNMMSDEDQLIGTKTLQDGNIEIVEGPVLIAMRQGCTLLLDEIDAGSANTLLCLQPILEGKPYYFKLKNEVIIPTFGFNIIATANTKGKGSDDGRYIGSNVLNEAFLERFAVTFEQEYPTAKVELKIIKNLMEFYDCTNAKFAVTLVKWAEAIRKTFADGGVDETITTRRISHIIRAYAIFGNEMKSIELCCNRFDSNTKTAFVDLYSKVMGDPDVEDEDVTTKVPSNEYIPF